MMETKGCLVVRFCSAMRALRESEKIVYASCILRAAILLTAKSRAINSAVNTDEQEGRVWDTVRSGKTAEAPTHPPRLDPSV